MTRLLDILFASVGLILGSPLLLLLTFLGWFDTRSPLFRQTRVGRNQETFTLVKFRTMSVGTASVAPISPAAVLSPRLAASYAAPNSTSCRYFGMSFGAT